MFKLYESFILDHFKNPRNYGKLYKFTNYGYGKNPLCGDVINLFFILKNNKINNISFTGNSCAISRASASILTEIIKNQSFDYFFTIYNYLISILLFPKKKKTHNIDIIHLKKINMFSNLNKIPGRIKCVILSWNILKTHLLKEIK